MKIDKHRHKGAERGVIAVFVAAVILPLMFVLFTLSFDIASFYTGEQGIQSLADDAAMYAYKFLPSRETAEKAAKMYLDQNGNSWNITSRNATVSVTADFVTVSLDTSFPLSFAKLFNKDAALPIKKIAQVRSTPIDAYIAIDTSSYLAPPIVPNQMPWDHSSDSNDILDSDWPAATFFTELYPIEVNGLSFATDKERLIAYSLLTQQCFNPVYSELKLAAISIYDYLSSFDLNSIGFGFYPGASSAIDQARSVSPAGLRSNQESNPGEADFENYYGGSYNSNVWCAGIAEYESYHSQYRFRDLLPSYKRRIAEAPPGEKMVYANEIPIFNEKYREYIQSRQVIWSRTVNISEQADMPELMRSITSALYSATADKKRGGLVASSAKVGLILSGGLPIENIAKYPNGLVQDGFMPVIEQIKSEISNYGGNLTLYLLFFKHRGFSDLEWDSKLESLGQFFKEQNLSTFDTSLGGSLTIRVINGESPADLVNNILPLLMLEKRTGMISQ